jgi:prephenate dehydrogenase
MKILILGMGHMGLWLARELRSGNEVAVYDRDLGKALGLEGVTAIMELPDIVSFKPELVINAVSLQNTITAFEETLPCLPDGCVISDVASIKTGLPEYYERTGLQFVSVHPMFGPTFANMDSLREENVIIIAESGDSGKQFFKDFFLSLGLKIFEYSFREHDRMMAYSLALPFVSSLAFAACVDTSAVPGTTFRKHMNIAKGVLSEDSSLLAEILFSHHSIEEVEKVTARLELLKHIIRQKDYEEAESFFERLRKNLF